MASTPAKQSIRDAHSNCLHLLGMTTKVDAEKQIIIDNSRTTQQGIILNMIQHD